MTAEGGGEWVIVFDSHCIYITVCESEARSNIYFKTLKPVQSK